MPIDDLARSDVVTADRGTPITEIATTMDAETVGSVVVTEGNSPVGIVTDRDLALRGLGNGSDPAALTAEDVMSVDICTAQRDAGFYDVAETMAENGVRRVPICDGDELVGIITADDITELIADEEQQLAAVIRAQRPAY